MAHATYFPQATFHSSTLGIICIQNTPQYLNSDTCSSPALSTRISHPNPSSPLNTITLLLSPLSFKPLPLQLNKTSYHYLQVLLRLATQNQVIYIQETIQPLLSSLFQKPGSLTLHPYFHFFQHCIYIHVGEPRGHDTTLSHTLFHSETLALTPLSLIRKLEY